MDNFLDFNSRVRFIDEEYEKRFICDDWQAEPESLSIDDWLSDRVAVAICNKEMETVEREDRDGLSRLTDEQYLERIHRCGTGAGRTFDPHTGRVRLVIFDCGCWRPRNGHFCMKCLKKRAELIMRKIKDAYKAVKNLGVVRIAHDEATSFVRKMKRHDYQRYPVTEKETGDVIDFILTRWEFVEHIPGALRLAYNDVRRVNAIDLAATPEPYRMSGSLGSCIVKDQGDTVKVPVFFIDQSTIDLETERRVMTTMFNRTMRMDPEGSNLQGCIDARGHIYIEEIYKAGGRLMPGSKVIHKTVKVNLSRIDWRRYTQDKLSIDTLVTNTLAGIPRKKATSPPESA